MPNHFYTYNQFYLKQVSLAWEQIFCIHTIKYKKLFYSKQFSLSKVHSLNLKNNLFQAIQFSRQNLMASSIAMYH